MYYVEFRMSTVFDFGFKMITHNFVLLTHIDRGKTTALGLQLPKTAASKNSFAEKKREVRGYEFSKCILLHYSVYNISLQKFHKKELIKITL